MDAGFARVLEELKTFDHDRYLSLLVMDAAAREKLIALYGLNAELARIRELVSEPMLGEIRLQWWRETVELIPQGETRGHDVAECLAGILPASSLSADDLIGLIDGRSRDIEGGLFHDFTELDAYVAETAGLLMRLGVRLVAGDALEMRLRDTLEKAARAYAYTGFLRALPFHASQGTVMLPHSFLEAHEVELEDVVNGVARPGLHAAMREMATMARDLLEEAREMLATKEARPALPVLLPLAALPLYLKPLLSADYDPFKERVEVAAFRLQWRLLRAQWRGRV